VLKYYYDRLGHSGFSRYKSKINTKVPFSESAVEALIKSDEDSIHYVQPIFKTCKYTGQKSVAVILFPEEDEPSTFELTYEDN
jgi:hypothetical protein